MAVTPTSRSSSQSMRSAGGDMLPNERLMLLSAVCTDTGRLPLHFLCANHAITPDALRTLLTAAPWTAAIPDRHGLTALHLLCCNRRVTTGLLEMLLKALPASARLPCHALLVRIC
jgi:hypothetical protein